MAKFQKVQETLAALPVAPVAKQVVDSATSGNVTVLAAPTSSGKSMLVPAMLADATNEEVLVLVPRRFLATDAAANVSEMAATKLGEEVGYAVGKMSGDRSLFSDKTILKFATYGYAISSGLINTAKRIVLDEVHEAQADISLARAILYERKKHEPEQRLLEMSATMNARHQANYWHPSDARIHDVKEQSLMCEERYQKANQPGASIPQTTLDLLTKEGRNGIAIFCPGVKEVQRTAAAIEDLLRQNKILNVEVVTIDGNARDYVKKRARAEPKPGYKKVIVGTNVIESGVNLRWVDAGISDGFGKIPYDREDTGAYALVREHLPQWRILQQRGRINRDAKATGFDKGIFILHSDTTFDARLIHGTPELARTSLTEFAFRAASLGYVPESLHVDVEISPARWQEAKHDLLRLGLVNDDWTLTTNGKYVAKLPLSPATGAMLCEASRMDVAALRSDDPVLKKRPKLLPDAIILAALTEQSQGLRKDGKRGHGLDGNSDIHGGSDLLDSLKAYLRLEALPSAYMLAHEAEIRASGDAQRIEQLDAHLESSCIALQKECESLNVNYEVFCDTLALVNEIRARITDKKALKTEPFEFDAPRYNALKQIILNGHVNQLFQQEDVVDEKPVYRDLLRDYGGRRNQQGKPFANYPVSRFSVLKDTQETALTPLIVGKLCEFLKPQNTGPDTTELVIERATSIPAEVFIVWAASHEPPLLSEVEVKGKEFSARYAGTTPLHFTLAKITPPLLSAIEQLRNTPDWQSEMQKPRSHWVR